MSSSTWDEGSSAGDEPLNTGLRVAGVRMRRVALRLEAGEAVEVSGAERALLLILSLPSPAFPPPCSLNEIRARTEASRQHCLNRNRQLFLPFLPSFFPSSTAGAKLEMWPVISTCRRAVHAKGMLAK